MTAIVAVLSIAVLGGCPAGDGDTGLDEELDTADLDGDGYAAWEGDCDDADGAVSPAEEEQGGNDVDENCDGTRFAASNIAQTTRRMTGSADGMGFGEVVVAVTEEPLVDATVAVAELARESAVAPAQVAVFIPEDATTAGAPRLVLNHPEEGSFMGLAVALLHLDDDSPAWAAAFSDRDQYGGLCAWPADAIGVYTPPDAAGCLPAFENNVHERVSSELTSDIDIDGDGFRDLLMGGMAPGANDEGVAALWLKPGPLTYDSFDTSPELLLTMSGQSAVAHRVRSTGDLTGDGYDDVVTSDSEATTDAAEYSGQVRIVAGGSSASDWNALDGIDGDMHDASTGAGLAAPDIDHDGQLDLCVGAPLDGTAGDRAGRVGCFFGPVAGRQTLGDAPIVYLAEAPNSFFGFELAALDLDHDGDQELAVGRPNDPYFGDPYPGLVYLFDPGASGTEPVGVLAGELGDGLGYALAAADTDGDGTDDLLAGAPWHDNLRGAAYLVLGSAAAW